MKRRISEILMVMVLSLATGTMAMAGVTSVNEEQRASGPEQRGRTHDHNYVAGPIKKVGRETGKVAARTAEGTGKVARAVAVKTADTAKESEHVTVHYTEQGGRKVAHLFRHI
ncbi:MAG TPA: hypothetical protein VJ302_06080 [Blastocatellia bacterium]|nr:hypothetical protein [Blastocatellia bacterium]